MIAHKPSEGNQCYKCSKRFVTWRDLKKHIDSVHPNRVDDYKKEALKIMDAMPSVEETEGDDTIKRETCEITLNCR